MWTPDRSNKEDTVECPVEGCDETPVVRGLYMHVFQTDDSEGEGHFPQFQIPDNINTDDLKLAGTREIELDYPESQNIEDVHYLDTYTGKAYKGKRGLMVHLGQMAGKHNIPEDVTDRHKATDFPQVEIDDKRNITEVLHWPRGDVPSIEPYLPWYSEEDQGYVSIPCCTFKINSPDDAVRPESDPAVMSRAQMLRTI